MPPKPGSDVARMVAPKLPLKVVNAADAAVPPRMPSPFAPWLLVNNRSIGHLPARPLRSAKEVSAEGGPMYDSKLLRRASVAAHWGCTALCFAVRVAQGAETSIG